MFTDWDEIGIGIREGGAKVVTTEDFVGRFPPDNAKWIVGVVYVDWDSSKFYSPGSGIQGVTVTLSQGNFMRLPALRAATLFL